MENGASGGLSSGEAARRLAADGPNALPTAGRRSPAVILLDSAKQPMFLLLLAGGVLADVGLIFSNRSRTRTSIESMATPNPIVWAVCVSACVVLGLALFVPLLAELFYFGRLALPRLGAACASGISSVLWFDAFKLVRRSLHALRPAAR
jgi:magnesium-transporting ATPase (P-type)